MRWLEDIVFLALVVGLAWPVGLYLAQVFERKPTYLDAVLGPAESLLYRFLGILRNQEMSPRLYTLCFLLLAL
jgi:K+-transporting ATPase ATPase A chain